MKQLSYDSRMERTGRNSSETEPDYSTHWVVIIGELLLERTKSSNSPLRLSKTCISNCEDRRLPIVYSQIKNANISDESHTWLSNPKLSLGGRCFVFLSSAVKKHSLFPMSWGLRTFHRQNVGRLCVFSRCNFAPRVDEPSYSHTFSI